MQNVAQEISQWERDCLSELSMPAATPDYLYFDKLVLLARRIGHNHVGLGMEYPTSANNPRFSFFCNYPPDWYVKYVSVFPKHVNSHLALGRRSTSDGDGWRAEDFYDEANAHNISLAHIYSSKCEGNSTAIIGLSASNMQGWTPAHAATLAYLSILAITPDLIKKNLPQARAKLSPVEKTYLRMVLDGKDSRECSGQLKMALKDIVVMRKALNNRFDRTTISTTAHFAQLLGLLHPHALDTSITSDITQYLNLSLLRRQSDAGK